MNAPYTPPLQELDFIVSRFAPAQRPLRIAYVTETYPPEINGVSMTVARFVQGLLARHHEVQLIRPRQAAERSASPASPRPEAAEVGLHEVLMRGLPIPRYPHLRMGVPSKRALVHLWSQQRPDVVHIATEGPLGWSALQAALHLKLPLCSDFRTNFHAYSRHYGIGWLRKPIMAYLRKFHNSTGCTLVPTEALRRELAAAGLHNLQVVGRGVDGTLFSPERRSLALRTQWGAGPDDLVLACVGRLAPEKNLPLLLRGFEQVRHLHPRARLLLVGDGPMHEELARRQVPGLILAGPRLGEELAAHYASADLFVFPSLTETFGNVTTEALASGLPVLAFDYAAAAQLIVNGEHGQRVALGDEAAFVQELLRLVHAPAALRRMGQAARQQALTQGWEAVVQRFEGVLRQVVGRPEGGLGLSGAGVPTSAPASAGQ